MSLTLIDLSGIFFRHWHATKDMEVSEAYERTIADVHAYKGSDLCAVCCDSPPYWRSERIEGYKANREAAPPMAREQFRRVRDQLRADGLLLWAADTFEADDVIAWACTQASLDDEIESVTVVSSDKDMLQLVNGKVAVRSPFHDKLYDADEVKTKLGVWPAAVPDYLAMVGDSSDNVRGVPGVGPKTASALVETFGPLEFIIAEAQKPEGESKITKPALKKALVEHAAQAYLARSVIQLRTDVPLDWSELRAEREPVSEEQESIMDIESEGVHAPAREQETAIARAEPAHTTPADWSMGLEPGSLEQAFKIATVLHKSRLYTKFANAESVWAVIIRGREMGLGALESLDRFHVIEGKPAPDAHLLISRAMNHPACEYFMLIESTDKAAAYETKRRENPKPTVIRYTIEQAERAGVIKPKGNWTTRPDEMLRKTAGMQLARAVYPDGMYGAYAVEELEV